MKRSAFYQSRDRLFVLLVWVMLILLVLRDPMLSDENPILLAILLAGAIFCSIPAIMHYKKWNSSYIRYVAATLLSLMTFYELSLEFSFNNYLLVYMNITLLSLYSSFRLMIFQGCCVIAITGTAALFHRSDPALIDTVLPLLGGALVLSLVLGINTHRSEKINTDLNNNQNACKKLHSTTTAAVVDLQQTVDLLYIWSTELENDIQETQRLCQEVITCLKAANPTEDFIVEETAAASDASFVTSANEFELSSSFDPSYEYLCYSQIKMNPMASKSGVYDVQERFLRITAKMLHLAENTTVSKQGVQDIKAGLSHEYSRLSELIQAIHPHKLSESASSRSRI